MKDIMNVVLLAVKYKLDRKFGCFELYGFDFLIDDQLNPLLIEINTNPALFTDTSVQKEMLPRLVEDVVKMALDVHPQGKTDGTEEVLRLLREGLSQTHLRYDVVYSDITL